MKTKTNEKRNLKRRDYSGPPRNGKELAGFLYEESRRNAILSIEFIAERFQIQVEIRP